MKGSLLCLTVYYLVNRHKQQDLINLLGATYSAILFLGSNNAFSVQSVVAVERTVFYRERAAGMYSELPYAFAQVRYWKKFASLRLSFHITLKSHIFVLDTYIGDVGVY